MRNRILSVLLVSFFVLTAWAQQRPEPTFSVVKDTKYKELTGTVMQKTPVSNSQQRRLAAGETGSFAEFDIHYKDNVKAWANKLVTIKTSNDGSSATLTDFFAPGLTVNAAISGNTISIAPQVVFNSSANGELWLCYFDSQRGGYNRSQSVTGTIDEDGTIHLASWIMFYVNDGYVIGNGNFTSVMENSILHPTNGAMDNVVAYETDSIESYPVYVEQPYDNLINIVNFAGNGVAVSGYVNPDQSIEITPQRIYATSGYGDFLCYPANWNTSGSKRQSGSIYGTSTPTEINLGSWGIFSRVTSTLYTYAYTSSKIKLQKNPLTYPVAKELVWDGAGTESSPYIINTIEQLDAFSESVNYGNDYKGKYIALGKDIDMSDRQSAYRAIGHSEGAPFCGVFDGKNHSINNLSIVMGQEPNVALIGYAGESSIIRNLKIDHLNLISYGEYAGGVVGQSYGKLENLHVTNAAIEHQNSFGGGIVGMLYGGSIDNCSFQGTIGGRGATGGVVGLLKMASAKNLNADASMTYLGYYNQFYRAMGGVVGYMLDGNKNVTAVTDSYFAGTMRDVDGRSQVGGVVGDVNGGRVERCFSAAPISTVTTSTLNGCAGGVIGLASNATIKDCYASNQLISTAATNQVGGIIGYILNSNQNQDNVIIENCYTSGQTILASATNRQGMYGVTLSSPLNVFKNCYYDNQITGNDIADSLVVFAKDTRFLTSGTPFTGYDTNVWTFIKGKYPVLKQFADLKVAHQSAAPLTLNEGENNLKVKNGFKIDTSNNTLWYIYTSDGLVKSNSLLTIDGDSVKLNNASGLSTLIASSDNGAHLKFYDISTVDPSGFVGSGTESDPYLIQTKEDLIALNQAVTKNGQNFQGDFFKQTNDIWLNYDETFAGVGDDQNQSHTFDGTYDGQGFAIHQMKLDGVKYDADGKAVNSGSRKTSGLFGYCNVHSVIKNVVIASDCKIQSYNLVGAVAAVTLGRIENCKNYADVTSLSDYAGGIVGQTVTGSIVTGCYNSGMVTVNGSDAGGIAAVCGGTVQYCQNDGEVRAVQINASRTATAQNNAGGIVGELGGTGVVDGNINTGYVHGYRTVGGITSTLSSKNTLTNNINYGIVDYLHTDASVGMVSGGSSSPAVGENNYYDCQISQYKAWKNKDHNAAVATTSKSLFSGQALAGLNADMYDWTKDSYPVLKAFKNEHIAQIHRIMLIDMPADESADNFKTKAALYQHYSMKWTLSGGADFVISGTDVKVNLKTADVSLRDTLTASFTDDHKNVFTKKIALRAVPKLFDGNGTEQSPYHIRNVADMQKLSNFTTKENFGFTGFHFIQDNDIDFANELLSPISGGTVAFDAEYNGNNMKLQNVNVTSDAYPTGLFQQVDHNAFIHNLTIESGTISGDRYVGGFFGSLTGRADSLTFAANVTTPKNTYGGGIAALVGKSGSITNSVNKGIVLPAGGRAGGIACDNSGLIDHCENQASMGPVSSAGIASTNSGTISNCVNHGEISGTGSVAGLVITAAGGSKLLNSYNDATITATTGSKAAGLVADISNNTAETVIENCWNTADVTGVNEVAGLIALARANLTLRNSYNTGTIYASKDYAGGLFSDSNAGSGTSVHAINCYNTGDIVSTTRYAGGLVGYGSNSIYLESCYNSGDVSCEGYGVGGIMGYGRIIHLNNVWNGGTVTGSGSQVGGIVGYSTGTLSSCVNLADVSSQGSTATQGAAGGIMGDGPADISDCYNMGKVTANINAAGILGRSQSSSTKVHRCYNAGDVVCPSNSGAIVAHSTTYTVNLDSVYYNNEIFTGALSTEDAVAKGLTTVQMYDAALGDAFQYHDAAYPTLPVFADNAWINFFAAGIALADGDEAENITKDFNIGNLSNVSWTCSDNFVINAGTVIPTKVGEGWLEKSASYNGRQFTYRYNLKVTEASGISSASTDIRVPFDVYTVSGIRVAKQVTSLKGLPRGLYIINGKKEIVK